MSEQKKIYNFVSDVDNGILHIKATISINGMDFVNSKQISLEEAFAIHTYIKEITGAKQC